MLVFDSRDDAPPGTLGEIRIWAPPLSLCLSLSLARSLPPQHMTEAESSARNVLVPRLWFEFHQKIRCQFGFGEGGQSGLGELSYTLAALCRKTGKQQTCRIIVPFPGSSTDWRLSFVGLSTLGCVSPKCEFLFHPFTSGWVALVLMKYMMAHLTFQIGQLRRISSAVRFLLV